MKQRQKAVSYYRAPETRNQNVPYEEKFAGFIRAIEKGKGPGIQLLIIAQPWVIGDTRDELIESLSRLAEAKLALCIAKRENAPGISKAQAAWWDELQSDKGGENGPASRTGSVS
jgi:hypothetical protein